MIENNLVSIIMPVYNGADYLKDAIESVLIQEFKDFEFIIINDGSTDDSEKIIQSYADDRIVYVKNETNLQLISTLNIGIKKAKGKYIARIDSDDIMLPNRISEQVKFLTKNPEYGLIGSYVQEFGDSSNLLAYSISDQELRYAFIFINPFVHSSVMFLKSILIENQLEYNPKMLHVEDYELWVRMLGFTKVATIPKVLVKYRVHQKQISTIYTHIQLENSRIIQLNYLQSIGFHEDDAKLLIQLFHKERIEFKHLFKLIDIKNRFDIKFNKQQTQRLLNYILTLTRDTILNSEKIPITEFIKIIFTRGIFTIKQKIGLTKRYILN